MGFPFLAPLSPWIVEVLKEREESTFDTAFKNPYAILTSAALVVQGTAKTDEKERKEQLKELINNPGDNSYKGCIISNNSNDIGLSYQTGKTLVGIDFTGKPIYVDGETGRKVSTPIIESIDIDTDGANNTLKTARINVVCFTLKQLEMFELFFMKPGMNVLLEWGDSSLLKSKFNKEKLANVPQVKKRKYNRYKDGTIKEFEIFTRPEAALVEKTGDYDTWCRNFSDYYRSSTDAIVKYLNRIEQSLGTYDLVAGKVMDYNFSIGESGTYKVMLEITQGNQVSLAIPHNPPKKGSKEGTQILDKNLKPKDQIIELIAADFNLDKEILVNALNVPHPIKGGDWSNDWFNFLKINTEQKDTTASQNAYISLRFILKILMNYVLVSGNTDESFFTFNLPIYNKKAGDNALEKDGLLPKKYNVLPVTSNKFMISSSDDVIFPSKELPTMSAPKPAGKNQPALSDEENVIKINKDTKDGTINGYDFHTTTTDVYVVPDVEPFTEIKPGAGGDRIGDALNIFLKYESIVKIWNKTQTRIDFLEGVLSIINSNSYGLFTLIYGLQTENAPPTIIDYKSASEYLKEQNNEVEIYRFKPTTIKSIVKSFSFNFEMSNLVAGRTLFNSNKVIAEAKSKLKPNEVLKVDTIELPPNAYKSIDNSTFANSDGWYSINNVELKRIEASFLEAKKKVNSTVSTDTVSTTATKEAKDLSEVVNTKSVKFKFDKPAKGILTLIYKDTTFIQDYIAQSIAESKSKKSTLSPITVTIVIDGFSGFRCGQYFNIDGIPEIYNQIGVFQITNTKHNIQKDGWSTTIEAEFRIINKKK